MERTNSSADALKRHTERIISVGITNKIDEALLKRISESISGASPELGRDYFTSVDFDSLKEQVEMIVQQTCVEITPPPKPGTRVLSGCYVPCDVVRDVSKIP